MMTYPILIFPQKIATYFCKLKKSVFLAEDYGINQIFRKNVFLAEDYGINKTFRKICENRVANL
jgi:hypothetical protein